MLDIISNLIPVILLSGLILYEKQMENIAVSPLGRVIAILLIVHYSNISAVHGVFICIVIIVYYYSVYSIRNKPLIELENFSTMDDFKSQNCKTDVLLNKGSPINMEMMQHVYPDIHFTNEKCNPCSDTCEFSIIEEQLKVDETLKPKTSDDFSLNRVLEKITEFVPAIWVKSEPFATLSDN